MRIHYRGYAYPRPARTVFTRCSRKVSWLLSTDFLRKVTCGNCLRIMESRRR